MTESHFESTSPEPSAAESKRLEPTHLGPYRVVERLGEGGMGVVYLAVGPNDELVAVKTLRPWIVGGQDGRTRFEREVAVLRQVHGDRVAEVIDADLLADPPYLVVRYVRGEPLDRVVAKHGPLRWPALITLASGLAEALSSVHAAGVVHRDVKPGNVLMADDGPVLIDFGLARAMDETKMTATGLMMGTAGYLAPEVVRGADPTPATDIHGWAATVAFAATARPPYGTGPDAVLLDRIRRGEHQIADIEPSLATVLYRALSIEPTRRPSISDLLARLAKSDLAGGVTAEPAPATGPVAASNPPTRTMPAVKETRPPVRPRASAPADDRLPEEDERAASGRGAAPDKRIPPIEPLLRTWPARLVIALVWLAVLILVAMTPRAGVVTLFIAMVAARTATRVRRSQYERRIARRYHYSDRWITAAGMPWHVFVSGLRSAFHLVWISAAALVAGAAVGLIEPTEPRLPYLAGGTVALLLAWVGPATARIRNGARILTAPLDRSRRVAWIAIGLLSGVIWVLALLWQSYGNGWPPLTDLPGLVGL